MSNKTETQKVREAVEEAYRFAAKGKMTATAALRLFLSNWLRQQGETHFMSLAFQITDRLDNEKLKGLRQ